MQRIQPFLRSSLALALCSCLSGCTGGGRTYAGIDDSAYVSVMSRLAYASSDQSAGRPAAAREVFLDSARTSILADAGISADSLLAFAAQASAEPEYVAHLWEAISAEVDSLRVRAAAASGDVPKAAPLSPSPPSRPSSATVQATRRPVAAARAPAGTPPPVSPRKTAKLNRLRARRDSMLRTRNGPAVRPSGPRPEPARPDS